MRPFLNIYLALKSFLFESGPLMILVTYLSKCQTWWKVCPRKKVLKYKVWFFQLRIFISWVLVFNYYEYLWFKIEIEREASQILDGKMKLFIWGKTILTKTDKWSNRISLPTPFTTNSDFYHELCTFKYE